MCHGKMDEYILRFNGELESHSRSLCSTQCGMETVVNSESLKKSWPGIGKVTLQQKLNAKPLSSITF